jgi:hypothetical protein
MVHQFNLKVTIQKKNTNGGVISTIADADVIGPVNNFLHSMFEQVHLSFLSNFLFSE